MIRIVFCADTRFLGGDDSVVEHLRSRMLELSAALEFEAAARIRDQLEFCARFCRASVSSTRSATGMSSSTMTIAGGITSQPGGSLAVVVL